ncbi:MAG TPA: complex I NDUFA9 subunit family protein [Burkholderiaceae bacterium]|nr:complex I NDUFA9 subunit family protein [Burkholderiaceae bacterium]
MNDRLLILGGSGFVGRSLCGLLVERSGGASGEIVVPSRHPAAAKHLQLLPTLRLARADVHDEAQLTALLRDCDAVVNLVAILHGSAAAFERTHVALPRTLARACAAAGVRRVVHVSALGVGPDAPSAYLRSKAAGEAALRAAGLDLSVLRPSVIFGAHDRFLNLFARLQAVLPVFPLAGAGAHFQPVWVHDVAAAIVRCLDDDATIGQVYECAGPEVFTLADLVRAAGRWSGHARPVFALPDALATLQAGALELLPGEPLMSRDNLASMRVPSVATGSLPGLAALGIAPARLAAVAPGYLSPGQGAARLDRWRARRGG